MCSRHIGSNLVQALRYRAALWLVLAPIFADVFGVAGIRVRNLALYSFYLGLAASIFWYNSFGLDILKPLRRDPSAFISVREQSGATRSARVIPEMLVFPVLGNYLPGNLAQFAELFQAGVDRDYSVSQIQFANFGSVTYAPTCEAELLRPLP